MSKHSHKNQESKNRLNTVTSIGQEGSYKSQPQPFGANEEIFISEQDIQRRAYEIHEQKGGSEVDNWLEAEKSLREEHHPMTN